MLDFNKARLRTWIKPVFYGMVFFICCEICVKLCDKFVEQKCTLNSWSIWYLLSWFKAKDANMCYYARLLPLKIIEARNNYFYEGLSLLGTFLASTLYNSRFVFFNHDYKITSVELEEYKNFPLMKGITIKVYGVRNIEGKEGVYLNYQTIRPWIDEFHEQTGNWNWGESFRSNDYNYDLLQTIRAAEAYVNNED